MFLSQWRRWLGSPRRSGGRNGVRPYRLQLEALEDRTTVSTVYGLTPGNALIRFDSASPNQVTVIGTIFGIGANETVRGIDFRPRTGQLFASTVTTGAAANSTIFTYTINPLNAQATFVGATAAALAGAGDVPTGYDFNPTVDRIRYVNTNDENARLNPGNGALASNDTDLTPAATTTIIGEAYDRNFDRQRIPAPPAAPTNNPIATTLYAIDRNDSQIGIQGGINGAPSPDAGVITDLAPLGFNLNQANDGGFDIAAGAGLGRAFAALTDAADNLTRLYSLTLPTALSANPAATSIGLIGNGQTEVRSITVAPDSRIVLGSGPGAPATVFALDGITRALQFGVFPYGGFQGGVSVASGDVTGDGVPDVITGAGPGAPGGHVRTFDGLTGAAGFSFLAFPGFTGGVSVASGDLNADGFDDMIVAAGPGAPGGHVQAFSGRDGSQLASFLSFPGFTGGVSVAAADFDLNGTAEIVVGAGAGAPGGHVQIFGANGQPFVSTNPGVTIPNSFLTFPGPFAGGVSVAAGDVNGDGFPDVVSGAGAGGPGGHVRVFSGRVADPNAPIGSFLAFNTSVLAGANVALADANSDGLFEIRVTPGAGVVGQVFTFNFLGQSLVDPFFSFGGFTGGTFVGGARAI